MIKARYRARKSIDYHTDNFLHDYETFKSSSKKQFEYLVHSFSGFDDLTIERRDELKKEAIVLQKKYCENNNALCPNYYIILNKLDNAILGQKKYVPYEAIALLIETIDPTLKLTKIFLSSKTDFEIESKSTKEFGFYDSNLIDYELAYAKRFNKSTPNSLTLKQGVM